MEFYGCLLFFKVGIVYVYYIIMVSEIYVQEIIILEYGCGLYGIFKYKVEKCQFSGIVNGIDDSWQLYCDLYLVVCFSVC